MLSVTNAVRWCYLSRCAHKASTSTVLGNSPLNAPIAEDMQAFDNRMVTLAMQRHELRLSTATRQVTDEEIQLCDGWVLPWATRATSGQTMTPELTGMEIDPSKFAMSISNTLANAIQGGVHATECYNLKDIMEGGIKAGRDLMEDRRASGRLHSHWGYSHHGTAGTK